MIFTKYILFMVILVLTVCSCSTNNFKKSKQISLNDTISVLSQSLEMEEVDSLLSIQKEGYWYFIQYPYLLNYNLYDYFEDFSNKYKVGFISFYDTVYIFRFNNLIFAHMIKFNDYENSNVWLYIQNRYIIGVYFKRIQDEWIKSHYFYIDKELNVEYHRTIINE